MSNYFLFIFIISITLIKICSSNKVGIPTIYAKDIFTVSCDSHFFYLTMNITSSIALMDPIPFELSLLSPQDLKMKCIIDTTNEKIECFSFVPKNERFKSEELFFHLFYYPPKLKVVDFDSNSFIKYSRKWENTMQCGNGNYLLNSRSVNFSYWNEIKLLNISGGECESIYEDKEQKNNYYFNLTLNITDSNITDYLKIHRDVRIEFVQDANVPIFIGYKTYDSNILISSKEYAHCGSNYFINRTNYENFQMLCKINIPKKAIMISTIKISSFFDKIYIRVINFHKITFVSKVINIFFNLEKGTQNPNITTPFLELDDNFGNNIICPNKPIFHIANKDDGIFFDSYSNTTNRFTFFLKGKLTNGHRLNQNDNRLIPLFQTNEEISFPLILTDNTLEYTDDSDTEVKCILSSSTFFNEDNTLIRCSGEKKTKSDITDLTLNYVQKKNNNCSNIIINWPDSQYYGNKKNFYSYKIIALSMQQKNYYCNEGNYFIFYINIYDLNREPKLWFDLPLLSPEGQTASCELFDPLTLICELDLRYTKLKKKTKIYLPKKGTKLKIRNNEGNENIFVVNDFSDLGKNEYYYIELKEDCGENIVLSTLQDMGLSKKTSIILTISTIAFILLLIIFSIFYIVHCFKERCKRGQKLAMTEESRDRKI